jgi:acylphosphatase
MECLQFIVSGKVQGVYYRKYTVNAMRELGIIGFVKNLKNGDVEVVIKNRDDLNIATILEKLNQGSPNSVVENISMQECKERPNFSNSFEVRY